MLVRLIISPPPLRALMYLVTNLLTNVRGPWFASPATVWIRSGYLCALFAQADQGMEEEGGRNRSENAAAASVEVVETFTFGFSWFPPGTGPGQDRK